MPSNFEQIHCQRCRAANAFGQELCARCGTRLMLVIEPPSLRFDEEVVSKRGHDEHLVERISLLENKLARITGKLEEGLDLMLRQARISYYDHVLLETLVAVLSETGTINPAKLEEQWRACCERNAEAAAENDYHQKLRARIVTSHHGPEKEIFTQLVQDGFDLLDEGKTVRGIRLLERAAALAPDSSTLNSFIGEHFFQIGKMALARDYLASAFKVEPSNPRVCLLLGLACGDEGDASQAKDLLCQAVRLGGTSFAAHYALGRLLIAEAKWADALVEFKRALAARACPEVHYIVGLVNFQLNRNRVALRHLQRAVEMDPEYTDAFYVLGLVYLRVGEREFASQAFDAARAVDLDEARYRAAKRYLSRPNTGSPPLLSDLVHNRKRQLVTGGDSRLAALLREDALALAAVH